MADVETHIANLAQLPRSDDRTSIRRRLTSAGMCLLVGESGSGKSALAKEIALADYPRTIWLSANILDHESAVDFERAIALRHPLVDILRSAPTRCLVVFDGVETYTERALRMTARIATELLSFKAAHVHLLFSLQFQSADAKMRRLAALGIRKSRSKSRRLAVLNQTRSRSSFPRSRIFSGLPFSHSFDRCLPTSRFWIGSRIPRPSRKQPTINNMSVSPPLSTSFGSFGPRARQMAWRDRTY